MNSENEVGITDLVPPFLLYPEPVMDSGEISAIVAVIGLVLSYFGAAIDPSLIQGAVSGIIAIVTFGAALWSWYLHRTKNATIASAGL